MSVAATIRLSRLLAETTDRAFPVVDATSWARSARRGKLTIDSYATFIVSMVPVTAALREGLRARVLPVGEGLCLGGAAAFGRDELLFGGFARQSGPISHAWRSRIEGGLPEPALLVSHSWVLSMALPPHVTPIVEGIRRGTGLTPTRGLAGLTWDGGPAGRQRWLELVDGLVLQGDVCDRMAAEAVLAVDFLRRVFEECS